MSLSGHKRVRQSVRAAFEPAGASPAVEEAPAVCRGASSGLTAVTPGPTGASPEPAEASPGSTVAPPDSAQASPPLTITGAYPVRSPRWLVLLAAALVALLVVALVPMVAISAFDHSYADDWHYGVDAYLVLQAGGGIAGAVRAAIQEVIDTYDSWQGTYSAIFLMALQPGVFSEALYGAGAVGIMASLVLSTGYATSVAVRDVVGASRAPWLAVTCVALLLQTQLLPSPVEGFWWYNSAIYYTFYHALMLGMAGLAVRLLRGCTHRGPLTRHGVVLRSLLLTALAFVVAGGNFVTGLVSAVGLFAVAVAGLARRPRRAALLLPALFVLVAGFVVSMAAPGNEARQVSQFAGDNLGVVLTLVRSGLAGIEYAVLWTNGYLVLGLLALLPVMVRIAQEARCSYHLPGVPALASLALFMASFAPTFYSMGTVGPGRVQNIRYDLFVLAVLLCVGWFVGWCVRRAEAHGLLDAASPPAERPAALGAHARPAVSEVDGRAALPGAGVQTVGAQRASSCRRLLAVLYASIAAVLAFSLVALAVDSRHVDDLVSISAAHALMTGTAQEYDQQVCDRIDLIESSPEDQLEVPFYTVGPKVLFMGDIRDNMDNYINFRLAQWYGKESIVGYHGQL